MVMSTNELEDRARHIRLHVVQMIGPGNKGHLGGSCSIADVITVLYFHTMRHDPANPQWQQRDRLLLSKGHAALIQYAALAEAGYYPEMELDRVKALGAMLQGHPDMLRTPGIEANTGSLGQGLSIGCGMAAGLKLDGQDSKVYVVIGDGELCEGQIWEAAMAAAAFKLDNLVVVLDNNHLQATGPIAELFDTGPLPQKWQAFGWHVQEIDGHNMADIVGAFDETTERNGKPHMIVADTVKGKGVSFAEHNPAFHNGSMTQEQYDQACAELTENGG